MPEINNLNIIKVLKDSIELEIKTKLVNELTNEIFEDISKNIKPKLKLIIEKAISQVSITHIDKIKNLMSIREDINVYCKWSNEND